ncbi:MULTISPECIES: glutamate--cysteine ligase [Candidatus Ichthyocystis]|uniref:glutamate--cysteine ligase n=1 Tax=Candidatus Ichthyocystis TaxID=2929841 RepID=UPI000AE32728|nr:MULTISPECIES: glutamate--cysteine ligase [Ichthyocystis]
MTYVSNQALSQVQRMLWDRRNSIEDWFTTRLPGEKLPIYCSVDIRHSGSKIAVIDTNLFPAGFNNIHQYNWQLCADALKSALEHEAKEQAVLIVTEDHTRNRAYLENIYSLNKLIKMAGLNTYIVNTSTAKNSNTEIPLGNNKSVVINSLQIEEINSLLGQCFILLNNDLSGGVPPELAHLARTRKVSPPILGGWFNRSKYLHLKNYNLIANSFGEDIGIDPWHLTSEIDICPSNILKDDTARSDMVLKVAQILEHAYQEYQKRNIDKKAFVVIKTDPGTYGMGVITVESDKEALEINRSKRKKLTSVKGGAIIRNFILQEGIHSAEKVNNQVAENTIYAIKDKVVGGFIRTHHKKNERESLNSVGSTFVPMKYDINNQHHYVLSIPVRLAMLAVAEENIHEATPDSE